MKQNQLPVALLPREITWGIRYLLFQLVFLGALLSIILSYVAPRATAVHLDTVYFVVNLAAVFWIFRHFLWFSFRYGIGHWKKLFLSVALGFLVYNVMTMGVDTLIRWIRPEFYNVNDASIVENTRDGFWVTAFGTVILVPAAEETLYRGLIFGALRQRSRTLAYIISVAAFAVIHIIGYFGIYPVSTLVLCFLQYIPAGLVLAGVYEYSGSILAPVLIHAAVNALAILSMR